MVAVLSVGRRDMPRRDDDWRTTTPWGWLVGLLLSAALLAVLLAAFVGLFFLVKFLIGHL